MTDKLSVSERIVKRAGINRIARMRQHYRAIKDEISPKTASEKQEAKFFMQKFEENHRKAARLAKTRFVLYLFLYASLTVNVFKAIPFLAFLVGFIEIGNALLGSGLLFAAVLVMSMKINLHLELMNECLTHLIALYHKNGKHDTEKVLRKLSRTL